jgi:hypothetical protein
MIDWVNAPMSKATPPLIFCEDFALVPRGGHEGKPNITFGRPVNLLSAASGEGATTPGKPAAHVLVLNLDGQLYIRDLGGTASLHWNGNPTTQASLRHGDKVRLGKIEYDVNATRFTAPAGGVSDGAAAELIPASGGAAMKVVTPVSLIGASDQAELRLAGENVPEVMAMVLRIGPGYWLWNLEPAFPCRVNGEVVVRVALAEGSTISIAGQDFRFNLPTEATPVAEVKAAGERTAKSSAKRERAGGATAIRKGPAPSPPASPLTPAAPPISATQPVATSALKTKSASAPAPVTSPTTQQLASSIPATVPSGQTVRKDPDEEADVFKQWGPLAFAVAAADRPELQIGGSKSGDSASGSTPPVVSPSGAKHRFVIRMVGVLILVAILTGGAYVAWKRLLLPHGS